MNILTISRKGTGEAALFSRVHHARTPWQRFRGLIARPRLAESEGMLISPCGSVHTVGMRYPLDLVFMDKEGKILKCVHGLRPFRMAGARSAHFTLELAAGEIDRSGVSVGDVLSWQNGKK